MRQYKKLFQCFLLDEVKRFRAKHRLTKEAMAEILCVEPRSYFDMEHGNYGFSSTSLVFFLLALEEEDGEVRRFLTDFRNLVERTDQNDIA